MPSSSSTSNFEFSPLERAPVRTVPWAAIAFVASVMVMESFLARFKAWYADEAAWYWKTKADLVAARQLEGDVAILGTSVLFHGIDPLQINNRVGPARKAVNLSLNGMQLPQQYQTLARCLDQGMTYELVIVELRDIDVPQENWLRGPFFQFWATASEFLQSGIQYHRPQTLIPFAASRLLPSYAFNRALDNLISMSARAGELTSVIHDRNRQITADMTEHLGFAPGGFAHGLTEDQVPAAQQRPWTATPSGLLWLDRLLELCARSGARVAFLLPPAPPFVEADRAASNYYPDANLLIRDLQSRYPELEISVIHPDQYGLADFADDHHLSYQGRDRLSADVAQWIQSRAELRSGSTGSRP